LIEEQIGDLKIKFNDEETKYLDKIDTKKKETEKAIAQCDSDFSKRKAEIEKETKIIENFNDCIKEANKNMRIYFLSALGLIVLFGAVICFGLYGFKEAFSIYSSTLTTTTQDGIKMINSAGSMLANAGSIFILKLPLSFVLIAFIAGFYQLLKSILITYEKINKDKRNASAIYAIMNTLNAESVSIISGEEIDLKNTEEIGRVKEKIKWDKVSEYFTSLQKEQEPLPEKNDNQNMISIPIIEKMIDLLKLYKK
jgi:hypothetical protein